MARSAYQVPETHLTPPAPLMHRRGRGPTPDANRPAPPPWWAWGSRLGQSGSLIGPSGGSVGSKPRHKQHERGAGVHGDLNITHGAGGLVTITHQPHGEDAGDAASPGAIGADDPNYGSGSIAVDTDPMVSEIDVAIGNVHGIGTPGSFEATLAGGGIGPYAMATDVAEEGHIDDDTDSSMPGAYQPYVDDPYSPPLREPTRRMYLANFGFEHELYSGFGPAAIIGCDMGCATDTELRG